MTEPIIAARHGVYGRPTRSPFGEDDQIGMLNVLTEDMSNAVMARADLSRSFDLAVDFFIGMPAYTLNGDPHYQICLTHAPPGNVNEGVVAPDQKAGFTGDVISMYTHTGTHLDTLNHLGYGNLIWNGYSAETDLGSRHWNKCGAEHIPPILTRGVLLDFPKVLGVESLENSYGIGADDIHRALDFAGLELQVGDVVLFRTGRMQYWPDLDKYADGFLFPGLNLEGATVLAEAGAVIVGSDCMAPEQSPSAIPDNFCPVHSYLLATCGVMLAENVWLEDLSAAGVYEFAFSAAPLKLTGATGAPVRPVAYALRDR